MPKFWFDPRIKAYRCGYLPMKGVRPLLEKWFYPRFKVPEHKSGDKDAWRGLQRGRLVDREITCWANHKPTKHSKFTRMLIQAFKTWGWRPVKAQVVVGHDRALVGTAVDLLVRDKRGRFVVVEIKCGGEGYLTKSAGALEAPLQTVPNCTLFHYILQLLITQLLFKRVYKKHSLAYVVVVSNAGVRRYSPSAYSWKKLALETIVNKIQHIQQRKRKRSHTKRSRKKKKKT